MFQCKQALVVNGNKFDSDAGYRCPHFDRLFLFTNDAGYLILNVIPGVIILLLACFIGISVPIDVIAVIISAIAGIPGAILVILLYVLGITHKAGELRAVCISTGYISSHPL